MLLNFFAENWMSFKDGLDFSMLAGRERLHGIRVPSLPKHRMRVLPVAALFGGNASGKTNFFRAFSFVKGLVTNGTRPNARLAVEPFVMTPETRSAPTSFKFDLLCGEDIYDFGITLNSQGILRENLSLAKGKKELELYRREGDNCDFPDIKDKEKKYYQYVFEMTRKNQLFLTNAASLKLKLCQPVYDWFSDTLNLISPDARFSHFERFISEGDSQYELMNDILKGLDTGISRLEGETIVLESLPVSHETIQYIRESLKDNDTWRFTSAQTPERFFITRSGDELVARRLVAVHEGLDGELVKFSLSRESDGTLRVIELIPAYLDLMRPDSKSVFLIDELERSVHTLVTSELLEMYLYNCSKTSRSQLLFTTHDLFQMTNLHFRRDEMWLFTRGALGASTIESLYDIKGKSYDKDLVKDYLSTRFQGVPDIFIPSNIKNLSLSMH